MRKRMFWKAEPLQTQSLCHWRFSGGVQADLGAGEAFGGGSNSPLWVPRGITCSAPGALGDTNKQDMVWGAHL